LRLPNHRRLPLELPLRDNPAQSEEHAVVSQYGKDAPKQLGHFSKITKSSYWDDGNFTALFKERRSPSMLAHYAIAIGGNEFGARTFYATNGVLSLCWRRFPRPSNSPCASGRGEGRSAFQHLPDVYPAMG